MKVWVVVRYDGYEIVGVYAVFASEELANQEVERLEKGGSKKFCVDNEYDVVEHPFNPAAGDFSPVPETEYVI